MRRVNTSGKFLRIQLTGQAFELRASGESYTQTCAGPHRSVPDIRHTSDPQTDRLFLSTCPGLFATTIDERISSQFRGARTSELAVVLVVMAAKRVGKSQGKARKSTVSCIPTSTTVKQGSMSP
jgi:hypothetical protein